MRERCGLLAGAAALLLSLTCDQARAQVSFKEFAEGCLITSMSADGSVAVGNYNAGADAFRWTAAGGVELIGVKGIFNGISISRDGSTIVGTVPDSTRNNHAAIWQGGRNWRTLTPFPEAVPSGGAHTVSFANAVSADGSVIVGGAYVSTTKVVAFRWEAATGMVNLGTFDEGPDSDSTAYAVSADGRNIIGWDSKPGFSPAGPGGASMNGRRGAIWWDGKERLLHAFGWAGEAWVTNDVGSIIAGQFHPLDASDPRKGASSYLWTAWDGRFENLGAVPTLLGPNYISEPYGVSDDGSVVGGNSGGVDNKTASIWTPATGMVSVSDYLTMNGVTDHLGWDGLIKTSYISPDGRLMAGVGYKPYPFLKGWIVTLK